MKTLVLGIGSPFCDDQFGWKVAENIQSRLCEIQDLKDAKHAKHAKHVNI